MSGFLNYFITTLKFSPDDVTIRKWIIQHRRSKGRCFVNKNSKRFEERCRQRGNMKKRKIMECTGKCRCLRSSERDGGRAQKCARSPGLAKLRFLAILKSRAISPAISLVSRHLGGAFSSLFLLVYHGGAEEFLQRHNSARELPSVSAYRRLRYKEVRPASGIPRIPPRQRWSSVWNLADGRKNEQWANGVHAVQLFPEHAAP